MKSYIEKIRCGGNLTESEIEQVMHKIISGDAVEYEISAFLTALNDKGFSVQEMTGAAKVMRQFFVGIETAHPVILDTCGTGGDQKDTFNISTITALVVAGCGVVVAKHGNRSVSSRCGSACVLEALGVNIDSEERRLKQCLEQAGIAFLFAQKLHPAMKHVAPVRKRLGVKTIFNILGPLANPARATHQVMGVYSRDLVRPMAEVLKNLGIQRALVVHGSDGLDEITTTGKTFVAEFDGKAVITYDIDPTEVGIPVASEADLRGGDIEENARIAREILDGVRGPKRDIVVLNAAYALYTVGKVTDISEGLSLAGRSIDEGKATKKLEALKKITNS